MERITFTDGTKICLLQEDGTIDARESKFILQYKENARRIAAANEWKYSGEGYRFREGAYSPYENEGENTPTRLNGVAFKDRDTVAYSFTVGGSSGIYYKNFSLEKEDEAHLIHSNTQEFLSLYTDRKRGTMLATTGKNGGFCYSLSLFGKDGDYNNITDGDSKDENPSYSLYDGNILFDSAGVGRNGNGEFIAYAPAGIYALNSLTFDITTIKEDKDYSYIKPRQDEKGDIYAIKLPAKQKSRGNLFLDILLIPVRIIEALVGFVRIFVELFARKPLVGSANTGGNNPAKNRDERKIFIEGYLVETDKELKRNSRSKEKDYGFIPLNWQLVKIARDGSESVLKKGIADFALGKEGVYCTNGRHIYVINDSQVKKLADAEFCLHLDVDRSVDR